MQIIYASHKLEESESRKVKQLILGCTLILSGVIGFCSEYLKQAIYYASPNNIITTGSDYHFGIILMVIGVVFSLWGFLKKGDDE